MSFGYSISDVIGGGELALRVYREYRHAPAHFAAISIEVGSLHLVLKDVDSTIREHELTPEKEADLTQILNGCKGVLTDLEALLQKYQNVGKKTRSVTSRTEKQLVQLRAEIQSGKREGSVITVSSLKAAQEGDENIWREISRELEDADITKEMINEHREFITIWVINAIKSGQLEEKLVSDVPQRESKILGNKSDNSEKFSKNNDVEDSPYPTSDVESERSLPVEVNAEDGPDEFPSLAAENIARSQRLGREAMESSDDKEAEQQALRVGDVAFLLSGDNSKKAKEADAALAEKEIEKKAVQSELDNLLMVFGDLEEKLLKYKERLKSLGENVSDRESISEGEDGDKGRGN